MSRLSQIEGVRAVEPSRPEGGDRYELIVDDAETVAPLVARAVLESGGELLELRHQVSDLEAIFRAATLEDDGA